MAKTKQEIERLLAIDRELAGADAEFEHQQRRYGDQIERDGGNDWGVGDDLQRITRNRKQIAKERAQIAAALAKLQRLGTS